MKEPVLQGPRYYWWIVFKYIDAANQMGDGVIPLYSSAPWFPVSAMRRHIQNQFSYKLVMVISWQSITAEQAAEAQMQDAPAPVKKKKSKKK